MKRILLLIPLVFLIGCSKKVNNQKTFYAYGTSISISLYEGKVEDLDYLVDLYKNYSNLTDSFYSYTGITNVCDINKTALSQEVEISKELYDLLKEGIKYCYLTDNNCNIAIGHASFKWKEAIETKENIDLNKYIVDNNYSIDIEDLVLNEKDEKYYVSFLNDIRIDLGAIAKGYVNKLALGYLKEKGITKYLINSGQSSLLLGIHQDDRNFNIGLINPMNISSNYTIINISNMSVTTSGDYESFFEYEDVIYHHILSKELKPKNIYHSLTVVSEDPFLSDVASTALFSMEIEEAKKLCKEMNLEAIFYLYDGTIEKTGGFIYEKA